MTYKYLSYPFNAFIPVYGGLESITPRKIKSIEDGDSSNTFVFTLQNHWCTHVDAPYHFFEEGKKIIDYKAGFWVFCNPQVLDVQLQPGELLKWKTIANKVNAKADLLLLKSGWGQNRGLDLYWKESPGIHADVGIGLRNLKYSFRTVGIDWISVSSFAHREEGRKTHRAFLDPAGKGEPVLLIEDMDLTADFKRLSKVFVAPLIVEGIDSAPCTVIGLFDD